MMGEPVPASSRARTRSSVVKISTAVGVSYDTGYFGTFVGSVAAIGSCGGDGDGDDRSPAAANTAAADRNNRHNTDEDTAARDETLACIAPYVPVTRRERHSPNSSNSP